MRAGRRRRAGSWSSLTRRSDGRARCRCARSKSTPARAVVGHAGGPSAGPPHAQCPRRCVGRAG
eukprot:1789690-Lingulodinium_polyedra.AAC.1